METDQTGLTFRIMTLNLRFGRAEDGPNSWDNRKQRFIAFFEAHRPDFIGMQEVNDFQIDFLKKLLTEYHFIGQRSPAPDYWQDNLIFYKKEWKCGFHKRFFLSHTPSVPSRFAESKWPRQCVIGIFEKDGIALICANTHFDFDPSVQKQSAEIIIEQMNGFQKPEAPTIIAGDFNAKPGSPGYQVFTSRGSFREIFHGEHSGTYHGFTGECLERHIDWILYRGPLTLLEKEIIVRQYRGGFPSDHFPVMAQFRTSSNSSCPKTGSTFSSKSRG